MKTLLLLTTLDVAGRRNNREHAALRELAPQFDRTIVVFRKRAAPGKSLRGVLFGDVSRWAQGAVTYIAVDAPLSLPEGAVRAATTARPSGGRVWRILGQSVDTVAILRDRLTVAALVTAASKALVDIDPVDVSCEAFGPWAAEAARRLRVRGRLTAYAYVDRDYEPGFVSSPLRKRWAAYMETRAALSADLTFCIGNRLASRFAGVIAQRPEISPTGVDVDFFTKARHHAADPLHIAYVGEVASWSALDLLIEALAHPAFANTKLSLRGPALPGYREHIMRLAERAGLAKRFDWPGDVARDEIPQLLAKANLGYCLFRPTPLRCHAAPLKLLEYFAAALPAIATPGSEAGDLVQRSGAGLLCIDDVTALRRALIGFQAMAVGDRAEMAQVARQTAISHDWRMIFAREYQLLGRIAPQAKFARTHVAPSGRGAWL